MSCTRERDFEIFGRMCDKKGGKGKAKEIMY